MNKKEILGVNGMFDCLVSYDWFIGYSTIIQVTYPVKGAVK
jgi:hypothetical protein